MSFRFWGNFLIVGSAFFLGFLSCLSNFMGEVFLSFMCKWKDMLQVEIKIMPSRHNEKMYSGIHSFILKSNGHSVHLHRIITGLENREECAWSLMKWSPDHVQSQYLQESAMYRERSAVLRETTSDRWEPEHGPASKGFLWEMEVELNSQD